MKYFLVGVNIVFKDCHAVTLDAKQYCNDHPSCTSGYIVVR